MAVARRAGGADSFPEYFHVARDMPEETELQVHEEAVRVRLHEGGQSFHLLSTRCYAESERTVQMCGTSLAERSSTTHSCGLVISLGVLRAC